MTALALLDDLRQDARYALRSLARNPGFATVAVVTLALGIGANTAIFSVVNSVLLRPLPYDDPDRLVRLITIQSGLGATPGPPRRFAGSLNATQLGQLQSSSRSLTRIGIYSPWFMTLTSRDTTVRLEGTRVEASIFEMLGVRPAFGRGLSTSDEQPGAAAVIVLSFATWRTVFGGDPNVLGTTLTLDGGTYEVVGVMPQDFRFPNGQTQYWRPFMAATAADPARVSGQVLARLAEGVSLKAAAAEIDTLLRAMPNARPGTIYDLAREQDELVNPVRDALLVLTAAVGFVLLIACVNVANLLLARTVARRRELAVRMALGAGRGRIVAHILIESLLLAASGGVAGVGVAVGGTRLLKTLGATMPRSDLGLGNWFPRLGEIDLDPTVLGVTALVSIASGLLFGFLPAVRFSSERQIEALRQGMTGGSTDFSVGGGHRTRAALIVAEIAMAMVLLVGAGLLANSFVRLTRVDPGYDTAGIQTFQVALPPDRYQIARVRTFADDLERRLEQVPGVDGVAFARQLPMVQLTDVLAFGRAPNSPQQAPPSDPKGILRAEIRLVSHDYLRVMRVPVVRGRPFGPGDGAGAPRVVLVNEAMAHASFPGQDPIGQLVQPTRDSIPWEVVGIVKDMRQFSLDRAPDPQMFFDVRQVPDTSFPIFPLGPYYIVRTTAPRATLMSTVRSIVNQMEAQAAVYNVAAMDDIMSNGVSRARLYAVLVAAFAAIGGSLAAIGIYGAIAYAVGLRTREIGVRIALGARRSDVMTMVLGRTAAQAAVGIALGLAGAAAVSRYLRAMLFGLTPVDPATFFAVALLFSAVAALAAFIPARRATQVDPLVALRCE